MLKKFENLNDWQAFRQANQDGRYLVFKHSATCPVSAQALAEFMAFVDQTDLTNIALGMVVVQEAREVSKAIAEDLQLTHQSPQVLLVAEGKVQWHISHGNITVDNLMKGIGL